MSGTGFLRLKKLKGPGIIAAAARHNRRSIQAEVGASASIDPIRSRLNQTLQGPPTAEDVAKLAAQRLRDAGVGKLRKDAVLALECVFSLPHDSGVDDQRFFTDCAAWAGQQFGGPHNVLSVDVHRDEATPHCHVLLLPLVGGRMVGSDLMGNRRKLLELQQDFHQAVAARYGLRKAPARLAGASKQRAATAVLDRLKKAPDAALRSKVWTLIRDAIEHDPAPYMLALGIALEPTKKKQRTMTQIFTSKGRGGNVEKPIGFAQPASTRSLCSVGFAAEPPPPSPQQRPAPALPDARRESYPRRRAGVACDERTTEAVGNSDWPLGTTRERDEDHAAATFDSQTGEFRPISAEPERSQSWARARDPAVRLASLKAASVAWVNEALATATTTSASNDPNPTAQTPVKKTGG